MFHISHRVRLYWKFLFVENGFRWHFVPYIFMYNIHAYIRNDTLWVFKTQTTTTTTSKNNNNKKSQPASNRQQTKPKKKMVAFDFGARCFASIYAYFEPIARHRIRDIDWVHKSHSFRRSLRSFGVFGVGSFGCSSVTVDSTFYLLLLLYSSISLANPLQSTSSIWFFFLFQFSSVRLFVVCAVRP